MTVTMQLSSPVSEASREADRNVLAQRLGSEVVQRLMETRTGILLLDGKLAVENVGPLDQSFVPEVVKNIYEEMFSNLPESEEEWKALGNPPGGFNGISFGIQDITQNDDEIVLELGSFRNKIRNSYELAKNDHPDVLSARGVMLTGCSVWTLVDIDGERYLFSQIKGGAVDHGGRIHPARVAGGLDQRHMIKNDPIAACLSLEYYEETGAYLDAYGLKTSQPAFIVFEGGLPLGHKSGGTAEYASIVHVSSGVTMDQASSLMNTHSARLASNPDDYFSKEVGGWALISLADQHFSVNESGDVIVNDVPCFYPGPGGTVREAIRSLPLATNNIGAVFLQLCNPESPVIRRIDALAVRRVI